MDSSVIELQKFVQASHIVREKNLTIKDLGRLDQLSVKKNTDLYEACKLLSAQSRSGLPVLDEKNKIIGFLSEKDCLRHLYERKIFQLDQGDINQIMKKSVLCLEEHSSIYHVIDMFIQYPFHVFPVIDATGVYLGSVKRSDVFKFLL